MFESFVAAAGLSEVLELTFLLFLTYCLTQFVVWWVWFWVVSGSGWSTNVRSRLFWVGFVWFFVLCPPLLFFVPEVYSRSKLSLSTIFTDEFLWVNVSLASAVCFCVVVSLLIVA